MLLILLSKYQHKFQAALYIICIDVCVVFAHHHLINVIFNVVSMSSLRWRFSFLVSLVSCVPVMGMMMYMIIMDYQMSAAHQHNVTAKERNHYHSTMLLERQVAPGLSLMNLLSFLFCIPVQVNQRDCAAVDHKCEV